MQSRFSGSAGRTRKVDCYVIDKGYDSGKLHHQIREDIGANSFRPVRKWKGEIDFGKYGQEMYASFDLERYAEIKKLKQRFQS